MRDRVMDWLTALAIVTIASGVTIAAVVLLAVRALRRTLNDTAIRQSQQMRRLLETVATLSQQQQGAQQRILVLTEANRRLAEEMTALYERMGDGDAPGRTISAPRLLN